MTVYNGEKYLAAQLQSIARQSLLPDELLIGDDGSTDGTEELIRQTAGKLPFPVRYLRNETRLGYAGNFRKTADRAEGDILFFCDQDDVWKRNKLERMVNVMDAHPEIDVLVSSFWLTDAGIDKMRLSFDQIVGGMKNVLQRDPSGDDEAEKITWEKFLRHPKYPGMTAAVRRELWKKAAALSWPKTAAHDWMINELAAERGGFFRIPDRLVFYRQHGGNTTGTAADRAGDEAVNSRVKLLRMMADAAEMLCGRENLAGSAAGSRKNQEKVTARRKHIAVCTARMLRRRADLLEKPFTFETAKQLLFYDLRNLRYMSIQSLCGDLFCFMKKQRQFLN